MSERTDEHTEIPEPMETETRREPEMGEPGTLPSDRTAVGKAREAAGGRLEEVAGRVREIDEIRSDLETAVRRYPLASITFAFLAGYTVRRIF